MIIVAILCNFLLLWLIPLKKLPNKLHLSIKIMSTYVCVFISNQTWQKRPKILDILDILNDKAVHWQSGQGLILRIGNWQTGAC